MRRTQYASTVESLMHVMICIKLNIAHARENGQQVNEQCQQASFGGGEVDSRITKWNNQQDTMF